LITGVGIPNLGIAGVLITDVLITDLVIAGVVLAVVRSVRRLHKRARVGDALHARRIGDASNQ
jgi:hypothetical protein